MSELRGPGVFKKGETKKEIEKQQSEEVGGKEIQV